MKSSPSSSINSILNVAMIYGSTREGRLCDNVAGWAAAEIARRPEFALDRIDPMELGLPVRHPENGDPSVTALQQRIGRADAFVIVTPEYNHSFPAPLKAVIDAVSDEWQAKPVSFISYGGLSGGIRAVEQLRLVFAELHAVPLRDAVALPNVWGRFGPDGAMLNPERPRRSLAKMLAQLNWWAVALRNARNASPYAEVAA